MTKFIRNAAFICAAVLLASCGVDSASSTKSEEVKIKTNVPVPGITGTIPTSDIIEYANGNNDTKFGRRVDRIDGFPGVSVKHKDVRKSLTEEIELNKEAIATANETWNGKCYLYGFSKFVYSSGKRGNPEDALDALKIASEDDKSSIIELVTVWPAKKVEIRILKIISDEETFQKILDGLNDLNNSDTANNKDADDFDPKECEDFLEKK